MGGGSYISQVTNYMMSVCCSRIYTIRMYMPHPQWGIYIHVCVCTLPTDASGNFVRFDNGIWVLDWKWKECKSLQLHIKIFLPPPPTSVHKWGKTEGIVWKGVTTIRLIFQISVWEIPGLIFFSTAKTKLQSVLSEDLLGNILVLCGKYTCC